MRCDVGGLEPLLPEMWLSRMEAVAETLKGTTLDRLAHARLIRLVYHLCLLAPDELRIKGLRRDGEACLEALIAARQYDCAAFLLLGSAPALNLQRSDKEAKASVRLFPGEAIGQATAPTTGQAILAAIVECMIIEHRLNLGVLNYPLEGDRPRRYQSGSHQ